LSTRTTGLSAGVAFAFSMLPPSTSVPVPRDHVIDLGDLAVLDAAADVAARRLRAMHDADADIVLVVDGDDADLRVVDRVLRGLLDADRMSLFRMTVPVPRG
jgi:hypothetical protein